MLTTTCGLSTHSVARNGMGSGTTPTKRSSYTLWVARLRNLPHHPSQTVFSVCARYNPLSDWFISTSGPKTNKTKRALDVSRQGICGRGVLIDWYRWARAQSRVIDATTAHPIPFSELMEALRHQGMSPDDILQGDILIIRSGYIEQYESLAEEKAAELNEMYKTQKPSNICVEPSRELLEFLWEKRIAAVCGDSRSFEVWPCTQLEWHLHEWLLAGWGMPIGELFELNGLSEACAEKKRWTTFLSTSPMNVSPFLLSSFPSLLWLPL